jgi:hypothetical protein
VAAALSTMNHHLHHQSALLSPYPTLRSQSHLQQHHTPNLRTIPSITRTTRSSFDINNNSSDDIDDDYDHHHYHHQNEDDDDISGEEFFNMLKGDAAGGGGLNSSVRFAHNVTVMDRLDSVDSGCFDDSDDYDTTNNNGGGGGNGDVNELYNDSSRFDIGYSLSARDLQDLHQQESQDG